MKAAFAARFNLVTQVVEFPVGQKSLELVEKPTKNC